MAGMAAVATLSTGTAAMAAPAGEHAAAAAPRCTVTMHISSRISLTASTTKVPITMTGCTNRLDNASVQLSDPKGKFWDAVYFTGAHRKFTEKFKISDAPPIGRYKLVPQSGFTTDSPPQQVVWGNSPTSVLKLGSKATIATSRHGSKVTISTLVRHFSGSGWKAYTHKTVGIQIKSNGKWKTLGFAKTNSHGRASLTHTAAHAAYYRVSVGSTSSYWGSISGSSRR